MTIEVTTDGNVPWTSPASERAWSAICVFKAEYGPSWLEYMQINRNYNRVQADLSVSERLFRLEWRKDMDKEFHG